MSAPNLTAPVAAAPVSANGQAATISLAAVEFEAAGEPAWLRDHRLAAFATYESLPMPKWSRGIGSWWTTDISAIKPENLLRTHGAGLATIDNAFTTGEAHAGLI